LRPLARLCLMGGVQKRAQRVDLRRKGDGGGGRRCWVARGTTVVHPWLSGDACVEGEGEGYGGGSLVFLEEEGEGEKQRREEELGL